MNSLSVAFSAIVAVVGLRLGASSVRWWIVSKMSFRAGHWARPPLDLGGPEWCIFGSGAGSTGRQRSRRS
eukprot:scaffold113004_cov32-Tisochrysis_lutea.AAC.1